MPYKDPDKQREHQRKWKAARRQKFLDKFGNCCGWCGGQENLEFDHIDPTKKVSHRIWSWAEDKIEEELLKCRLLCKQCHLKAGIAQGYMPYTYKHGTGSMYENHGCRCDKCRAYKSRRNARRRRRKLQRK